MLFANFNYALRVPRLHAICSQSFYNVPARLTPTGTAREPAPSSATTLHLRAERLPGVSPLVRPDSAHHRPPCACPTSRVRTEPTTILALPASLPRYHALPRTKHAAIYEQAASPPSSRARGSPCRSPHRARRVRLSAQRAGCRHCISPTVLPDSELDNEKRTFFCHAHRLRCDVGLHR
ncbi:hypothetical protein HYPSUDRAFT_208147 [Hypholoma sublateritium FD-334 SS-4]|uniref:Uncharacterized protein n=1 Tax=Hypholoma sublateritium (strain FD-334 SS-4) TaxID=945553 RepID=A0A0D2N7I7_HYPSF|nr:hypothetical protein HYPSUDRAFT_208147 [Hypholoma sublateritium FD-334 SS-4]